MNRAREMADALRLTRPRQWPILSAQLLVGVALALPGGSTAPTALGHLSPGPLLAAWAAWVVLLNGGTLAFNSAWDRDTGAVAYLRRPPAPPGWLAGAALAWMAAGVALGAWRVGPAFGAVTGACVLLSAAYSHPRPRLKGRPGLDLAVNMAGYGAGTTAAGLLAGHAALPGRVPGGGLPAGLLCLAFGLLFGSFYPLTQIYQLEADRARGDRTLTTRLGAPGALALALALGFGALVALEAALAAARRPGLSWLPAAAMFLWLAHLSWWRRRAAAMDAAAHERGMYRALWLWAAVDAALVAAWLA